MIISMRNIWYEEIRQSASSPLPFVGYPLISRHAFKPAVRAAPYSPTSSSKPISHSLLFILKLCSTRYDQRKISPLICRCYIRRIRDETRGGNRLSCLNGCLKPMRCMWVVLREAAAPPRCQESLLFSCILFNGQLRGHRFLHIWQSKQTPVKMGSGNDC